MAGQSDPVYVVLCGPDDQTAADFDRAWAVLDDEERGRAQRLVFDEDRRAFVLAHGMLRVLLANFVGSPPGQIRFATGTHGRPELSGDGSAPLHFNLSHTRGLVGCAVTRTGSVGFDVERRRVPAPLEVAEQSFSAAEVAALLDLPPSERDDRFYALWTLKEAYVKGQGQGLGLPLDSFTVLPTTDGRAQIQLESPALAPDPWLLRHWSLPGHRAALAVQTPSPDLPVHFLPAARLESLRGLVPDLARAGELF